MNSENGEIYYGSTEKRTFVSRAVLREIKTTYDADSECGACEEPIKYRGVNKKAARIIANVYEDGEWQRTVIYHPDCYEKLGSPYGRPFSGSPLLTIEEHEQFQRLIERYTRPAQSVDT